MHTVLAVYLCTIMIGVYVRSVMYFILLDAHTYVSDETNI